jgi:GPH family glycoside/pentoside/hexuronide:cation symporter
VIPICATFWAVWSPPAFVGPALLGWWLGIAVVLYYLAQTLAAVPHLALGAELSTDHHERTRIFGARALLEFGGMGAAVAAMASLQTSDDPGATAQTIAACFSLATVVLLVTGTLRTSERPEYQARATPPPGRALRDVARNPHARIVIGVMAIDSLSFSMMGVLFPFIAAYVLPGDMISSSYVAIAITAAVVLFPSWFLLARRFGKRAAWLTALYMRIAGFAAILFVGPETAWLTGIALFLVGGSLACNFIIPPSIKSDVIDYDELMTGDRKEGSYFAAWNLVQKLASGAAIGISGLALQVVGYEANAVQDPTTTSAMLLLFAGVPLLLHLIAVPLLLRLRLDAREHERIRNALAHRRGVGA